MALSAPEEVTVRLDLASLVLHASWPVRITVALLVLSSVLVWLIATLKYMQLGRLSSTFRRFEDQCRPAGLASEIVALAKREAGSPGARVVLSLAGKAGEASLERLRAIADRAIVAERRRARSGLSPLGSIAASAPFIGLFGTVYGIMDAFVRIGAAKSASLPVVAPAIGEALVTTAIGLAAAIPAVIFYNGIDKRVSDLVNELEAAAGEWVCLFQESKGSLRPSSRA